MVVGMAVRRRIVRLRPMEFENLWMQRREGLYADTPLLTRIKMAKRGNMRLKRLLHPSVHRIRLYSELLDERIPLSVTTHALRRIEQAGGLDSYLLKTPDALLNSDVGSDLRFRIGLLKKQQQFDELKQDIAAVQQERRRRVVELLEAAGLPGLKALAQGPVTAALAQQPQPGGSSSSSSSAGAAPLPQQPAQQQQQLSSS